MQAPVHIAMWSGPRNISTAMMRSWENRPDTVVVDEPFYAFYLKETGTNHPGAEEVIAGGETDWRKVVELCGKECGRDLSVPTSSVLLPHCLPFATDLLPLSTLGKAQ